jgi:hypothetical protein
VQEDSGKHLSEVDKTTAPPVHPQPGFKGTGTGQGWKASKQDGGSSSADESTIASLDHVPSARETLVLELGGKAIILDVAGEEVYLEPGEDLSGVDY